MIVQTHRGKCYVFTMVESTTGCLEMYPVFHTTARSTILCFEKQVLWRNKTPERSGSKNETYFKSIIDCWAREHSTEECLILPLMHQPLEQLNGTMDCKKTD